MQNVRGAGLEPARVTPYAPQTYASASFATRARFAQKIIWAPVKGGCTYFAAGLAGAAGAFAGAGALAGAACPSVVC